jgi:hypothetical protein
MLFALLCTYPRPPFRVLAYACGTSWDGALATRRQAEEAGYPLAGMDFWIVRLDLNVAVWWRI